MRAWLMSRLHSWQAAVGQCPDCEGSSNTQCTVFELDNDYSS
jgi:hypothetical protein